jgi:glycosyltransferase involved in cell wall biosynthesis
LKKIVILTEYFPPSYASTGLLLEELADNVGAWFDVTVLTSIKKDGYDESGKSYRTKRFPIPRFDKNRKAGKIFNGLSFFVRCFFYILFRTGKSDELFIVSNPPYLPAVGYFFYKLRRQPFIYLIHDQYPEIAVNLGYLKEGSFAARTWESLNRKVFSTSRFTIALGEKAGGFISEKYPVIGCRGNLKIIPNWNDRNVIFPVVDRKNLKAKFNLTGKFVVQYSGNLGLFHGLEAFIEAAYILKDNEDIIFQFVGDGGKKKGLAELAAKKGLNNVRFDDFVKREDLNDSLNCADIALISLDGRASNLSVPSKFYGILAAGIPAVALMDRDTDVAADIAGCETGFVCDGPQEAAGKILALYADAGLRNRLSANARKLFTEKYDAAIIMAEYRKLFKDDK